MPKDVSADIRDLLTPYIGRTLLAIADGGDCMKIIFDGEDGNMLCLYDNGTASHGFVNLKVIPITA